MQILSEEPELGDASLYHAVLAAICAGAHKRSDIARTLGRPDSALSHPLDMLERVQLIRKVDDALRSRRPLYQVNEPLLRLHHLIIRPFEARLVGRGRAQVWAESADTVASLINGPHLEDLARSWCVDHASTQTLGGLPSRCAALIACREHKINHELHVVVTADTAERQPHRLEPPLRRLLDRSHRRYTRPMSSGHRLKALGDSGPGSLSRPESRRARLRAGSARWPVASGRSLPRRTGR